MSRISSKICLKAGSGARHMVRYVSRKGSQPVRSLLFDFPVCENRRHFQRVWIIRLAPGERVGFHRHALDYFWTCVTGGFIRSRSNSAAIAGGQADRSALSLVFSSIVRAMAFLQGFSAEYRRLPAAALQASSYEGLAGMRGPASCICRAGWCHRR
jgi:hypothetical protein